MRRSTKALLVAAGFLVGVWIAGALFLNEPVEPNAHDRLCKNGDAVVVLCDGTIFQGYFGHNTKETLVIVDRAGYITLINKTKITAVVLLGSRFEKDRHEISEN